MSNINKNDLNLLYSYLLEMEGLVQLIQQRGDETPQEVFQMLREKHIEIDTLIPEYYTSVPVEEEAYPDTDIASETIEESEDDSVDESIEEEEIPFDKTFGEINETVEQPEIPLFVDDAEEYDDFLVEEPEEPADKDEAPTSDECLADDQAVAESAEFEEEEDAEHETQPDSVVEPIKEQADNTKVDVSALKRCFTLNDRFRFRRELFGNSDSVMNETINILAVMHSLDEAKDYLIGDLEWDEQNQEVADFIDILANYYKA